MPSRVPLHSLARIELPPSSPLVSQELPSLGLPCGFEAVMDRRGPCRPLSNSGCFVVFCDGYFNRHRLSRAIVCIMLTSLRIERQLTSRVLPILGPPKQRLCSTNAKDKLRALGALRRGFNQTTKCRRHGNQEDKVVIKQQCHPKGSQLEMFNRRRAQFPRTFGV